MVVNGHSLLMAAPIKDMLPAKVAQHGVSHGLSEAGYDIRIKQSIRFRPKHDLIEVLDGTTYSQEFGRLVLASSVEEFQMPSNLVGIVHDKSTWARRGLSVLNTVVEPSWKGWLTLELIYHGREELVIPAGAGIAQVIFHRTELDAFYDGKYNNQEDCPVPARESK